MLTPEQMRHFDTFGFIKLPQVYSSKEVAEIRDEFDDVLDEARGRAPFDGKERQAVQPFVETRTLLTHLLEDDRLYRLHEDLMGPGFQWISSDGNLYVGDTQWHPDREGPQAKYRYVEYDHVRIKTTLYLDPVTKDTGCVRIIPGSHRQAFHEALRPPEAEGNDPMTMSFGVDGPDLPGFAIESQPGDVIVFNQLCWHSSWGGRAGRRMLALSMVSRPTTDEQVEYLKETYGNVQFNYRPHERWVNSDSPRIRGMIDKLLELGFEQLKG